ncbi:hypothetical protein FRC09_006888, partial [Ceratobasidium sp. 395]
MNLAIKTILNSLEETAPAFRAQSLLDELLIDDATEDYLRALKTHSVEVLCDFINDCRSTGQRREGLRNGALKETGSAGSARQK